VRRITSKSQIWKRIAKPTFVYPFPVHLSTAGLSKNRLRP
jgi:hypothetical protein